MFKVQVTDDPSSIEAARAGAEAAECARIEGVFERLRACGAAYPPSPTFLRSVIMTTAAERRTLQRRRQETIPRLQAIAEGRSREDECVRLAASLLLRKLDLTLGYRALRPLLAREDSGRFLRHLHDLADALETTSGWNYARPAPDLPEAEAGSFFALLEHPDPRVAAAAVPILRSLRLVGAAEQLRRRIDDPVLGPTVRSVLAREGCIAEILDRAIAALNIPGDSWDKDDLDIVADYATWSPVPELAERAKAAIISFKESRWLPRQGRKAVDRVLAWIEHYEAAVTAWPAERERTVSLVWRLAAVGLLATEETAEVIRRLHEVVSRDWPRGSDWGILFAFEYADRLLSFDGQSHDDPPPHDELVLRLAETGRGAFVPEAVLQHREAHGKGGDWLQFVHRGRLYRMMISRHGKSFDTDHVVATVGAALEDAREPRRFLRIDTGDGMVELSFADPDRLRPIASEVGLELCEVPELVVERVASMAPCSSPMGWTSRNGAS